MGAAMRGRFAPSWPRTLVFVLVCVATAAMLFVSEASYRRSVAAIDELRRLTDAAQADLQRVEALDAIGASLLARQSASVTQGRRELFTSLRINRAGVALLSVVGLLAGWMALRQAAVGERRQREAKVRIRAERDALEIDVARRTDQLTQLARHLQTVREDERGRLARDLHDELGALLTSAKLDAARIRSRLGGQAPDALERLAHLVATLDQVIALKRRIAEDLRPSALVHLGLMATLEILAREFRARSGLAVHCDLQPVALSADAELTMYRLVQESINNLTKHAHAAQVWLQMRPRDGGVEVSVRDDGVGFDTGALPITSHGLLGMRFRVEAEGGTLALASSPGTGTRVTAWLPGSHQGN